MNIVLQCVVLGTKIFIKVFKSTGTEVVKLFILNWMKLIGWSGVIGRKLKIFVVTVKKMTVILAKGGKQ